MGDLFLEAIKAFGTGKTVVVFPNSIAMRPAVAILDKIAWLSNMATNLALEGVVL